MPGVLREDEGVDNGEHRAEPLNLLGVLHEDEGVDDGEDRAESLNEEWRGDGDEDELAARMCKGRIDPTKFFQPSALLPLMFFLPFIFPSLASTELLFFLVFSLGLVVRMSNAALNRVNRCFRLACFRSSIKQLGPTVTPETN